jgi:aminoglycoside phosphotransferase (APT) family kinase protein
MDDFGLVALDGGHSGETFLGESAGERTVVRIYARRGAARGPAAVEVDAAVLRLVRGLLPVPEVLELRRPDPAGGTPAVLVTTHLPGQRLDTLLPTLSEQDRARVGRSVGELTARLAQMPMLRAGRFVDGDLRVEPWEEGADLPTLVEWHRRSSAIGEWSAVEYGGLRDVATRAQTMLDGIDRVCLVHSDLNPKNLLVDPASGAVTGLLDWEFAHAGLPVADLGNALRFDRDPAFADAVLETHRAAVPDAGTDLLDLARAADLYALVDLAGRRGDNPVADRADGLLREIARAGDLHAT